MKIQVDNVKKDNRKHFKNKILNAIDNKGNVYFTLDKAIIELKMGYLVTEQTLIEKSKHKKAIHNAINKFRLYQFNIDNNMNCLNCKHSQKEEINNISKTFCIRAKMVVGKTQPKYSCYREA